jgi:hypothetical protein
MRLLHSLMSLVTLVIPGQGWLWERAVLLQIRFDLTSISGCKTHAYMSSSKYRRSTTVLKGACGPSWSEQQTVRLGKNLIGVWQKSNSYRGWRSTPHISGQLIQMHRGDPRKLKFFKQPCLNERLNAWKGETWVKCHHMFLSDWETVEM